MESLPLNHSRGLRSSSKSESGAHKNLKSQKMATYQEITDLLDQKLNNFRHYQTDYLEECLKLVTKEIKDELHRNIASAARQK